MNEFHGWSAERFRSLIKMAQVGFRDVERGAGVKYSNLRLYADGKAAPTLAPLIRLADYFCVPIDYLLGRCTLAQEKNILDNYGETFRLLQVSEYETRLRSELPPTYADRKVIAPWPYNLVEEIFADSGERVPVLTKD